MNAPETQRFVHVRTSKVYCLVTTIDEVKLLGIWWRLGLVVYTRDGAPLIHYARTRAAFHRKFRRL